MSRNAVRWAKEAGLAVTGHFVLGYPGETKETVAETIKFALEEPVDFAQFYCAVPFPGSALYERARKEGLLTTTDWDKFQKQLRHPLHTGTERAGTGPDPQRGLPQILFLSQKDGRVLETGLGARLGQEPALARP